MPKELGEQSLQVIVVEARYVKNIDIKSDCPAMEKLKLDFPVPGGPSVV